MIAPGHTYVTIRVRRRPSGKGWWWTRLVDDHDGRHWASSDTATAEQAAREAGVTSAPALWAAAMCDHVDKLQEGGA